MAFRPTTSLADVSAPSPARAVRSFDPNTVGSLECAAWVAYYRHDWLRFARSAMAVARRAFGLSWPMTVACSWLVLRANRLWAPYPDNQPERARRTMERFYRLVKRRWGEPLDPAVAAALEVEWWRVHRDMHHTSMTDGERALTEAIAALYAHVYGVPIASVREAAERRTYAMCESDRWVAGGCAHGSPLVGLVRGALIESYVLLAAAGASAAPQGRAGASVLDDADGGAVAPVAFAGRSSARPGPARRADGVTHAGARV